MFKRTPVLIIALFLVMVSVTGCTNTMEGMGEDMKEMGGWLQDNS